MDWVAQVFGGCCINVFLIEAIISTPSERRVDYGPAVTMFQFLFTAVFAVVPLLSFSQELWRRGFLVPSHLPKTKLMTMVALYFVSSIANNAAWKYGVSIPVHSMFRSCSAVLSLVVGYLFGGKRYTSVQVLSCILMSIGILAVITQLSLDSSGGERGGGNKELEHVMVGIFLLFVGSLIGAFLGLYTENLYKTYGSHWKESLFYLHLFALPLFILYKNLISDGLQEMYYSPHTVTILERLNFVIPRQPAFLLLNCISQVICARGVNKLTSQSTALTISVVLTLRKFASLVLSSIVFGNKFNAQGMVGSAVLIGGSILYSYSSQGTERIIKEKSEEM